jgi:hypothetical protein
MRPHSAAVQLGSTRRQAELPPDSPFYKKLWRGWQRVARLIGDLLSRLVTTLGFVIVLPLFALGVRLFSDPLQLKGGAPHWSDLPPGPHGVDEARSGF